MKKNIKFYAASLAVLLTLTACGGGDSADNSTPTDDNTAGSTSSADAEQSAPVDTDTPEPENLTEYVAPSGTYAVSVPEIEGGWTETDGGNDYHLVLDNNDKSFTVMIQSFPKEQATSISGLDDLVTLYQTFLSAFGDPTEVNVTIGDPAIAGVQASEYTAEQDGMTAKAQVSFFETDTGYYACVLTGTADAYDANIDTIQSALTSFKEVA